MEFSVIPPLAVFAAAASAALPTFVDPINTVDVLNYTINGCNITKCAVALGPSAVACLKAISRTGYDVLDDAACVTQILNSAVNIPSACFYCTNTTQTNSTTSSITSSFVTTASGNPMTNITTNALNYTIGGCAVIRCAIALGPGAVTCLKAISRKGHDLLEDATCVANVLNTGVIIPSACYNCTDSTQTNSTSLITSTFVATASGVPTAVNPMTNNTIIKLLNYTINGCAVTECAVALGPGGVSCVKAISKKGHDPLKNAACVANFLNSGVNIPSVCHNCINITQSNYTIINSTARSIPSTPFTH